MPRGIRKTEMARDAFAFGLLAAGEDRFEAGFC